MGKTYSIGNIEFSFGTALRLLPAIIVSGFWCYVGANPESVYDYLTLHLLFMALFVVLISYALGKGHRNLGIYGTIVGLSAFYGSAIIQDVVFPPTLIPSWYNISLTILNILGNEVSLLGAVSLGLWLASSEFTIDRNRIIRGATLVSAAVVFLWVLGETLPLFGVTSALSFTGVELLYSIGVVLTSSIFIPRRQFITVFYFVLGIGMAWWGLFLVGEASSVDSVLLGYYLRIFGTIFFMLFALPLGASSLYPEEHPENALYITATVWLFLETLIIRRLFLFSPVRVFAIYVILYFSMKNLKIRRPITTGLGLILGCILAAFGVVVFLSGVILLSYFFTFTGLTLAVVGTSVFLFCGFSFGEYLRGRFIAYPKIVGAIGVLVALGGLVLGTLGLMTLSISPVQIDMGPLSFVELDILFFALVSLGSMLIVLKPGRTATFLSAIGFASAPMVLFSDYFITVEFFYYPSLFLLIFFGVQQFRQDSFKVSRVPKKKHVPMEISPETLIRSGLHEEPAATQPPETIEPIRSDNLEPDVIEPPIVAAPVEPGIPVEPAQTIEPIRHQEPAALDISIKTNQRRIPAVEGENLNDEQRMARTWYNRAFNYLEVGELDNAIKAVETALKWQPDLAPAGALLEELQEKRKE